MKFALAALGLSATNAYTCSWVRKSFTGGDDCATTAGKRFESPSFTVGACTKDAVFKQFADHTTTSSTNLAAIDV